MAERRQTCSRCGGDPLWLITLRYQPEAPGGRLALYCDRCRQDLTQLVATSIPLALVNVNTTRILAYLYEHQFTESEPSVAVEVLGFATNDWVRRAEAAVAHIRGQ